MEVGSQKATEVIQVRVEEAEIIVSEYNVKKPDSGYIWGVEMTLLSNFQHVGCEGKIGIKDESTSLA